MSGYTTPNIPPEMFDAIIDQVYALNEGDNDLKKLLGVSSLVSKSWLPRSRYLLFQMVLLIREERTEAKPFMDLLDSPLCTFKPYVHLLELQEGLDREPAWLEDALPRLSNLPTVRDLTIEDGMFTSPNSAKVLSHFHNLQDLVLDSCSFGSAAQLFEALSICTSLESISLYVLKMDSNSPSVVNSRPPSSLRSVQIHTGGCNNVLMEWLLSGEQIPALETLHLNRIRTEESRAVGRCLQRLGPSLKNLDITVQFTIDRSIESENAFLRDMDLSYNTNLNSICFRSTLVFSLLAQVASSEVREVVVDVAWVNVEGLMEVDWDAIARLLDQPNFSKLERFVIILDENARDMAKVRRWMRQRLLPGRGRDKLILCDEWFEN